MKKWLLLAILALPSLCFSQGVRFDNIALQAANPLQGIPNAVITVCTSAGTGKPCAPLATTYTDATLATPCPGGAQVTLAGSNTCVSTGDSLGNFGFWLAANATYIYTVTAPGLPGYSTSITISCPTSGNCTFTGNVTFTNTITGSVTGNAGTATTATNLAGPGSITGNYTSTGTLTLNQLQGCQYVNSTQTFAQALAAVSNPGCIQITAGTYTVAASAVIPATVTLVSVSSGLLSIATGQTLTINGPIIAGTQPLFVYSGTGVVSLGTQNAEAQAIWFPGSDASAKIQNTTLALPPLGGAVDARNLTDVGGTGSTTIDPAAKAVTYYLGQGPYFITSWIIRGAMHVYGQGGNSLNKGTNIVSTNTSGPVFKLNSSGSAAYVDMQGFSLFGPGNTTQTCTNRTQSIVTDAISLDAGLAPNGGLWYSQLQNISVCEFAGTGLHIRADAAGCQTPCGVNQFDTYTNVTVYRTVAGAQGLIIEGPNYQQMFKNVDIDGNGVNTSIDSTATPNIYIGGVSGAGAAAFPYIITFDGLTSQGSKTAVQIDGASNIYFSHSHHEQNCVSYLVTYGASGNNLPTDNVIIQKTSFNSTTGIGTAPTVPSGTCGGAGTGAIFKSTTGNLRGVNFTDNIYYAPTGAAGPDKWVNTVNGAEIVSRDNEINVVGTWNTVQQVGTFSTSGLTESLVAASTINTGHLHAVVLTSGSPIATIASTLSSGEIITFFMSGSAGQRVEFNATGNIGFQGGRTLWEMYPGDTLTLTRQDNITGNFQITAFTSVQPPTITVGGCGGSAAAIQNANNGAASFNIFTGTAPTSGGCTITLPLAPVDWHCEANHVSAISTTNFIIQQTGALSTTSVTLQLFSDVAAATAPTASDTWRTTCTAN